MVTPDTVVIDLTGYKDRNGAHVPAGTYRVVVEDAEQSKAKTGNVMITVWLRIVGTEFDGELIVDRLTLTEKALFRVVGFLQAIGLKTPRARLRVPLASLKGKSLDVEVADGEPYMNRIRSEVQAYLRIEAKGAPELPVEDEVDPWETPAAVEADASAETTEEADAVVDADAEVDLEDIELR